MLKAIKVIGALVLVFACWQLLQFGIWLMNQQSDLAMFLGIVCAATACGLVLGAGAAGVRRLLSLQNIERYFKLSAVLVVLAIAATGCTRIGPGHVGIKVSQAGDMRGVDDIPITTGWVFYNPLMSNVYEWPTFVQQVQLVGPEGITFTSESMVIGADIAYSYSLIAEKVPAFFVKFRTDDLTTFTHGFLRNIIQEKYNEESKKIPIERITTGDSSFIANVKAAVQRVLEPYGIHLEGQFGIIGSPRLPEQVIQSINSKVQANQIAQQKQAELAQTQADMAKETMKNETYATNRLRFAEAEAEANRKVAASLTAELIELKRLERWNGQLPQVAGTANPFITLK